VSAESNFAWEPVTPRGVAAFAHASLERLLLVQFIVALLATASVVWFLSDGCCPTVNAAIAELPTSGGIYYGKLDWPDVAPKLLAEGRFLAFVVDPKHSGTIRSPAPFQIEFGRDTVSVFSLFGETEFNYTSDRGMPFNQPELEPLWGAWKPDLLGHRRARDFFRAAAVVGGAGDDLFSARLADLFFCKPRSEFPPELEARRRRAAARRAADDRWRSCVLNQMSSTSFNFALPSPCTWYLAGFISSSARCFCAARCRRKSQIRFPRRGKIDTVLTRL
jgi:hypothetical protein